MTDWELPETFDFHGREVRYGILGNGPPLVIVHGTPWSSFNLRHVIEGLSRNFTVYFYDLIGYGQSAKGEGDVSLGVQNKVLDELLTHWELECPVVVGHDFGGATLLRTHLINERDFKKMVLIDPVAISPWGSPFFRHVKEYEAAFAGIPDFIHNAIVRAYIGTAAYTRLDANALDATVEPWATGDSKAAFYRQIAQADSSYTDEVEQQYSSIERPVLILWGEADTWIPIARGERLHEMIPGSILHTIRDAGHLVIEEKPEELLQQIQLFLSEET